MCDNPRQLADLFEEVLAELDRATAIYNWPEDLVHQAAIVSEESGELVKAVNNYYWHLKGSKKDIKEEAIQTAAMAIRFILNLGE